MDKISYLFFFFVLAILYFRIAKRFNILDKPNHRSSHDKITIRGGGILFLIAGLISPFLHGGNEVLYFTGLFIIGTISFLDDLKNLPGKIRFVAQAFSVALMIYSFHLPIHPVIQFIIGIAIIGAINIYNFMDGINGLTGSYSLVILLSLFYMNEKGIHFISSDFILLPLMAVLVFLFFNFRKKAVCFAGDVGSVSIAFILLFLIGKLIALTGDFKYAAFLLLYGLDGVTTIFFRFMRGENLGEAHRSHFYQYLANERKWPHVQVSLLFAILQLLINFAIIKLPFSLATFLALIGVTFLLFVSIRLYMQGSRQLLKQI